MDVPINFWAIIAATVVNMVLGFLWYGPLFGKQWIALQGFSAQRVEEMRRKSMAMPTILMVVSAFLMNDVLAHGIVFGNAYLRMSGAAAGMMGAFWYWLGFIATVQLGKVLWEGKPWGLWVLDSAYYLATMLIAGAIIGQWPG